MRKALMTAMLVALAVLMPAFAAVGPKRTVTAVDDVAKTFSCRATPGEPIATYKTTDRTVYRVSGRRVRLAYLWNRGSFSELKAGQIVAVQFHLRGGDRIADRVAIYPQH